ncbi:MAG TPA: RimK domain-containing protein ATP-grasp [Chloroflexota bacterium]|jgi:glutathione synthase/RimK-type ligase-like ATP-grasp enzyme
MLTLVWGIATEPPIATVLHELERRGAPTVFLNQHQVLQTQLEVCLEESSGIVRGVLTTPDGCYQLEEVAALYARPYDSRSLQSVASAGIGSAAWRHAVAFDEAAWAWAESTSALVVNRLGPTSTNGSKPFQLERIRDVGFSIPATLITTDPVAADAFWHAHGDVVYKSISSTRSIVAPLGEAHRTRLSDVATCPTQFQARVVGTDFRVHVVGDDVFACRIESSAPDYRYPDAYEVVIAADTLPADVAERCVHAARLLGLHVAGIDLRRTCADEWFCFEVNPSPAFTYFEAASGLPIGGAIADLLTKSVRTGH